MSLWFTARGAGLSALILLSASICLGALASRAHGPFATSTGTPGAAAVRRTAERRFVLQYAHRACAGLGVLVLLLHISTMVADSFAHVGLTGALIPFTSGYRPTWIALGSLSAYCLLGVTVLGLARGRMAASPLGARLWRGLHGLSYAAWVTAMLHGFASGTDSSLPWVRVLYLACLIAVVGCAWVRLIDRLDAQAPPADSPKAPVKVIR